MPPGLCYLTNNVARKDNIMGSSPRERASWASGLSFSDNYNTISLPAAAISILQGWKA